MDEELACGTQVRIIVDGDYGETGVVLGGPTRSGGYCLGGIYPAPATFWPSEFEVIK